MLFVALLRDVAFNLFSIKWTHEYKFSVTQGHRKRWTGFETAIT